VLTNSTPILSQTLTYPLEGRRASLPKGVSHSLSWSEIAAHSGPPFRELEGRRASLPKRVNYPLIWPGVAARSSPPSRELEGRRAYPKA